MANAVTLKLKRSVWVAHISLRSQASLLTCLQAAGISANAWDSLTHGMYVPLLQECFECLPLGEEKRRCEISPFFFFFFFCRSLFRSTAPRLTSSSVNSQNSNKNRHGCRSAGATLQLQVSLFKTRLPSNHPHFAAEKVRLVPIIPPARRLFAHREIGECSQSSLTNNSTVVQFFFFFLRTFCDFPRRLAGHSGA